MALASTAICSPVTTLMVVDEDLVTPPNASSVANSGTRWLSSDARIFCPARITSPPSVVAEFGEGEPRPRLDRYERGVRGGLRENHLHAAGVVAGLQEPGHHPIQRPTRSGTAGGGAHVVRAEPGGGGALHGTDAGGDGGGQAQH